MPEEDWIRGRRDKTGRCRHSTACRPQSPLPHRPCFCKAGALGSVSTVEYALALYMAEADACLWKKTRKPLGRRPSPQPLHPHLLVTTKLCLTGRESCGVPFPAWGKFEHTEESAGEAGKQSEMISVCQEKVCIVAEVTGRALWRWALCLASSERLP